MKKYLNNILSGEEWNRKIDNMKETFNQMLEVYSDENWNENWKDLMDGKSVFSLTMDRLSNEVGINKSILVEKVKKQVVEDKSNEFNELIKHILNMFNN